MSKPSPSPLRLSLHAVPPQGTHVEGKAPIGFFDLPEGGEVAEDQPLEFRLELLPDDDAVTVLGRLKASFSLECGRCLERFKLGVNLENWAHSAPVLKDETIDLTEQVREDILLALPSYPRCEHGNIEPRVCPAEGRFETVDPVVNEGEDSGKPSVWDSLDQLN